MPQVSPTAFTPATPEQFVRRYRAWKLLVERHLAIWNYLNTAESFDAMRQATILHNLPAVSGITKGLVLLLQPVSPSDLNQVKKAVGAATCLIMETNGFMKLGTKRAVPPVPVRLFGRGEMYAPRLQAEPRSDMARLMHNVLLTPIEPPPLRRDWIQALASMSGIAAEQPPTAEAIEAAFKELQEIGFLSSWDRAADGASYRLTVAHPSAAP